MNGSSIDWCAVENHSQSGLSLRPDVNCIKSNGRDFNDTTDTDPIGYSPPLTCFFLQTQAYAESCEKIVHAVNVRLSPGIDEQELIEISPQPEQTNNKKLPPKFVTKKEARSQGWKPGKDLWSVSALRGSSIGGDHFKNLEGRLAG